MDVRFRSANTDDIGQLIELIAAYYEFDGIRFDRVAVERGLHELIRQPAYGGVWLIERANEKAGYFVLTYGFDLEFGGRQATVTEIYLRPSHRRQGVGAKAFAFIEGVLRAQGIGALELQAEHDNLEALAFYERIGFERHNRIPMSKRIE